MLLCAVAFYNSTVSVVWYQNKFTNMTVGPMSRMNRKRETWNYVSFYTHTGTNQVQLCVSVCYVEFTLESVWPYGIKRPILTSPPTFRHGTRQERLNDQPESNSRCECVYERERWNVWVVVHPVCSASTKLKCLKSTWNQNVITCSSCDITHLMSLMQLLLFTIQS